MLQRRKKQSTRVLKGVIVVGPGGDGKGRPSAKARVDEVKEGQSATGSCKKEERDADVPSSLRERGLASGGDPIIGGLASRSIESRTGEMPKPA